MLQSLLFWCGTEVFSNFSRSASYLSSVCDATDNINLYSGIWKTWSISICQRIIFLALHQILSIYQNSNDSFWRIIKSNVFLKDFSENFCVEIITYEIIIWLVYYLCLIIVLKESMNMKTKFLPNESKIEGISEGGNQFLTWFVVTEAVDFYSW